LIVIGHAENEVAFGQTKNLGIILQRLTGFGAYDLAVLAPEMLEQRLFLNVAGIVANDNLNLRAGPRAGLRDPGDCYRPMPVCWKQERELHEVAASV
jgi:hypothetical protein